MSYSKGPAKVVIAVFDGRGVTLSAYETIPAAVCAILDSAAGFGPYYGHPDHIAELEKVAASLEGSLRRARSEDPAP